MIIIIKDLKIKRRIISTITIILFILLIIIVTIYLYPYISKLNDLEYRENFIKKIRGFGPLGMLIIIGIFVLQAILAVIPSAPIELVAGLMYGSVLGLFLCLVGSTIGSLIVIFLVKIFGTDFVELFIGLDKIQKLGIIESKERTEVVMASILLMPSLPKDFLAFLVPFTKVKVKNFLIINFLARIPSTIVTSMLGQSIITGNYKVTIILIAVSVIVGLPGLIFNKQIVNFLTRKTKTNQ